MNMGNGLSFCVEQNKQSKFKHQIIVQEQTISVHVKQNAHCVLDVIDSMVSYAHISYDIVVEQNAFFTMNLALFQATQIDCIVNLHLKGDRSNVEIKGLYAGSDHQQINIKTYQHHEGKQSVSNLVIKGMLKDSAKAQYQGLIVIDQQAQGADAGQENKNIVLSEQAHVISVPSIEVLQHDVQCCHGSAIGKFQEEDMWYLQSKGLSEHKAYQLLIRSFFQDIVGQNDSVMEAVCQKMI